MTRLVTLAVLYLASVAHAQPASLGPGVTAPREDQPPVVDVLTFGVGDRIFEKFGHAAICLRYHDPANRPICFNYGVTDFTAGPIMIWRFLRSEQRFWVEASALGRLWTRGDRSHLAPRVPAAGGGEGRPLGMLGFYSWEDRDIWLQTLPLSAAQARAIEAALWASLEEHNRFYFYDHFLDNCTTRLRDLIDDAVGGKLRTGTDHLYPLTFRELGHRGLAELPPLIVLSDFVMGRQLDDRPTLWQAMFHPDVLRQRIEVSLGVEPHLIYARRGPPFPTTGSTGRFGMIVIALAFTLPLLVARWRRRFQRVALVVATVPLALWGLAVWSLVVLSPIEGVRWNEVALVVVPFDAMLPFLGETKRRRYARIRIVMLLLVSALCAVGVLKQPLWIPILTAFMPLAILAFELPHGPGARRDA